MLKANISINLTKVKDNASYISTSKKGEKWANLEINVKDMVDNYGQNITVKFSKPKDSQDKLSMPVHIDILTVAVCSKLTLCISRH